MKLSFQIKLFISLVAFFSVLFALLGGYYYVDMGRQLYQEMSIRAKIQAEEIALIPTLRQDVANKNIPAIHNFMQKLAAHSDASFIVIGDNHARHLFHSVFIDRVGTKLVGGDNQEVLAGKSTITIRKGGLGISLRSKVPILDDDGMVVGIVSVGYLTSYLDDVTVSKMVNILIAAVLLLIALFVFSWFFTRSIKKQIFSLEPREIGLLVRQQKAMMESIFEGVIAIDKDGHIEVINQAARKLLNLSQPARRLRGLPIGEVIAPVPFFDPAVMLANDTHDEMCHFNQSRVLASRVRIMLENALQGWVITFRDRNDIDSLSAQLSQVKRYVDNLRIMRHEQLNKMTTLSGLLHMGHYDEAIRFIQAQSEHAQELLDFLSARFSSPTICGLLLGKAARAREKGVELQLDPGCGMDKPFPTLPEAEVISIIGNLLDNAIEATQRAALPHAPVEVLIRLNERELIIEVADRGIGIVPELRDHIFERGVTTKTRGDHGIGLYLIDSYVTQAGGTIEVADNEPSGTIFSVFIPVLQPGREESCNTTLLM
ncbi:ATP-binding protein [Scandinavium manionii]|uniref:ATP-binding protein n=1 Tax=Scandinavium manionii TaxID=2926520 RepID=UPI001358A094|nr:sensor histidine kinase [Scandinavium manionii]MCS2148354.1 sensor histidine kinase [Scandinavium manionii]MCS2166203.1 sensor histidine kinase [Scandinavium manionii]